MDMFEALAAPFPAEKVSWRVGSVNREKTKAMALAYIDARDVMERLDAVCGPSGWERRHPHVERTTTCEIALWIEGRGWVVKADGAGDTQVEAEKGSLSDSFKRAAVNWGVGRYLYDLKSPWVEIDEYKKIKSSETMKLRDVLERAMGVKRPFEALEGIKGKSAHAAKGDGTADRFKELQAELAQLDTHSAVGMWVQERAKEVQEFPESWRKQLREDIGEQRRVIAEAQESADFRGGDLNGVSGHAGSVA